MEPDLDDPPYTYEAVAAGLPVDVREAIETSAPCLQAFDGQHMWSPEHTEIGTWGTTALRTYRHWECFYCHTVSRTDPRPLDSFARRYVADLPDAFEIASMFR